MAADQPSDISVMRDGIAAFLRMETAYGKTVGQCRVGVYAFYDFEGEPIYVGQTYEGLGARIGRHLTNQRTDAVAMSVLDPQEVAEIEVWPIPELLNTKGLASSDRERLNALERSVFERANRQSKYGVLNEKDPDAGSLTELPPSYRASIIPGGVRGRLGHPDLRIARRALTISNLAKVISERRPSAGLRATLVTQAQRLQDLAQRRLDQARPATVIDGSLAAGEDSTDPVD